MICNISYTYRKGIGPTVVLLHGWGLDKKAFSKIVNLINPKQSVLTLDFAGFGESDEPKDYYDTYEYTYHIFLFLKKINISEVVLVGHSFGGRVSIILSSIFNSSLI